MFIEKTHTQALRVAKHPEPFIGIQESILGRKALKTMNAHQVQFPLLGTDNRDGILNLSMFNIFYTSECLHKSSQREIILN